MTDYANHLFEEVKSLTNDELHDFIKKENIDLAYAENADITFILKYPEWKEDDEPQLPTVINFYYGEPDPVATVYYYKKHFNQL